VETERLNRLLNDLEMTLNLEQNYKTLGTFTHGKTRKYAGLTS